MGEQMCEAAILLAVLGWAMFLAALAGNWVRNRREARNDV